MMPGFQLSEPGSLQAQDPAMAEYLLSYSFPPPSDARYGFVRLESPQKENRVRLFGQGWVPMHPIGTIAILHGYAEHSGNYSRLVREMVSNQYAVITIDLRGHGLSEGPDGHLDSPNHYVEDVEVVLEEILGKLLPNRPLFLWAHSMGGLIGMQLLLRCRLKTQPKASVFTSPLLGFPDLAGIQKMMSSFAPLMARLVPALPVPHGIPAEVLSHDIDYLSRRARDPLIKGNTTPKWFESMRMAVTEVQANASRFQALSPTLLMLAGKEKVTNLAEARRFASSAYSGQIHKVLEFPEFFHELEKEPGVRQRIVSESLAWFRSHA